MDHLLSIIYPSGRMDIYMDRFFPIDQARLRKLLRVVDMADNRDELRKQMADFCRARAEELFQHAQKTDDGHTMATDLREAIKRQQERLDNLKKRQANKYYQDKERRKLKELKEAERLTKNAEVIES